jgi:3-dehydroquinate dehydratase-2
LFKVEIYLSNAHARESWRRHSMISPAVDAVVAGTGLSGHEAAVGYIL